MIEALTIHKRGKTFFSNILKSETLFKIKSIGTAKLFHCNYTHSRQIGRSYADDSFYVDSQKAMDYCENNRLRGRSFFINELPALKIVAGNYSFFVTQINTNTPLQDFNPTITKSETGASQLENCLAFGSPINNLLEALKPESDYWSKESNTDHLIILYIENSEVVTPLLDDNLKVFISKSKGTDQPLFWAKKVSTLDCAFVLELNKNYEIDTNNVSNISFFSDIIKRGARKKARKRSFENAVTYFEQNSDHIVGFDDYSSLFTIREYFAYWDKNQSLFNYVSDLIIQQLALGIMKPTVPERLHRLYVTEVLPVYVELKKLVREK